ncbi:MAG: NrfD/PsrC family molybdoenzyme membrane anchor subunit, partial [Polyangiales bacterium]
SREIARWWWPTFFACLGGTGLLFGLLGYTALTGIGLWGNHVPVAWGLGIVNFVFWIGIGHAGTFISAILYLCAQSWRTAINRIAETMTLFAVINAGLFPLIHLGRPWFAYWLAPYPSTMSVWPQFRSALPWDAAAVSTYLLISLLFWYAGLLPDLAAMRDGESSRFRARMYGVFALGWRGSATQWARHKSAYLILAGLATPLVVSVHTVVSLDFAITQLPGWHSTLFPPFFVAGAIYSGFAMVILLLVPIRKLYRLQDIITDDHLDACAKLLLATGLIVLYAYVLDPFVAWWSGDATEMHLQLVAKPRGAFKTLYWLLILCNCVVPQVFWSRRARRSTLVLFVGALSVLAGMWLERYVLITTALSRDFLPSSWGNYAPTYVDGGILFGTFCFFGLNYLLVLRFLPFVPLSELEEARHAVAAR